MARVGVWAFKGGTGAASLLICCFHSCPCRYRHLLALISLHWAALEVKIEWFRAWHVVTNGVVVVEGEGVLGSSNSNTGSLFLEPHESVVSWSLFTPLSFSL